ncbi:MAG: PilZ domain-containing protein [Candidatus Omnitrophota bacterium]|nr:PilZ domain-containing protein [Candidatus Omnitrophota bacterium]
MKKTSLKLFLFIFFTAFMAVTFAAAEEITYLAKNLPTVQESDDFTRIVITTSGPTKFISYWLDNPTRLVVEFQTKNVAGKIGNELNVGTGIIKKINSEYYGGGQDKILKSLTFELLEKAPYKIWQEENNVILDIQASLAAPLIGSEGKEVFAKGESREEITKRLQAMDAALKQVSVVQAPSAAPELIAKNAAPQRKTVFPLAFWLIGLISISSVGSFVWLFWRRYKLILDKKLAASEIAALKTQLEERNQLLEHEQIIRKTVESTSLQKENEFDQLKTEFQNEQQLLEQEQEARKIAEEGLSQKEKEIVETKDSLESLKEVLVEKGIAKKLTTVEKKGELWITGKTAEKRELPRLDLSKDYNRTIILRVESADKSKSIKSFANNIGLEGLCFETRHEFNEKEKISVRLFFFGDKVPMMRMQAKVIWSKMDTTVNRYGISFTSQEEKDKTNLSRYIEAKMAT